MRLSWFRFLSGMNKTLLPKVYRKPDLEQLSGFDKAIVGWKMWVTYRRLDAESARQVTSADASASAAQTAQA
jgi:hypothetical protein